ncbi:MAG: hypothetical protein NWE93_12840 [Candidatus Bathyarchaeota archaeon]|nr:hypothetical protein [Candidatus Bathyarchaeota archaeon]
MTQTKTKMLMVTAVILATVVVCSFVTVAWWNNIGGLSGLNIQSTAYFPQTQTDPSFILNAKVDLSDGMSLAEATSVATGVFSRVIENASCTVQTATSSADGIWTVNLNWETNTHSQHVGTHIFGVEINPAEQTAIYSRY